MCPCLLVHRRGLPDLPARCAGRWLVIDWEQQVSPCRGSDSISMGIRGRLAVSPMAQVEPPQWSHGPPSWWESSKGRPGLLVDSRLTCQERFLPLCRRRNVGETAMIVLAPNISWLLKEKIMSMGNRLSRSRPILTVQTRHICTLTNPPSCF